MRAPESASTLRGYRGPHSGRAVGCHLSQFAAARGTPVHSPAGSRTHSRGLGPARPSDRSPGNMAIPSSHPRCLARAVIPPTTTRVPVTFPFVVSMGPTSRCLNLPEKQPWAHTPGRGVDSQTPLQSEGHLSQVGTACVTTTPPPPWVDASQGPSHSHSVQCGSAGTSALCHGMGTRKPGQHPLVQSAGTRRPGEQTCKGSSRIGQSRSHGQAQPRGNKKVILPWRRSEG